MKKIKNILGIIVCVKLNIYLIFNRRTDMDEVKEEPAVGPANTRFKAVWNKVFCFFNAPVIIFMYNVVSM